MSEAFLVLRNKPSLVEIEKILKGNVAELRKSSPSVQLSLITTLLEFTIPETYSQLPENVSKLIVQMFQSVVGIGNLIGKASQINREGKDEHEPLMKIYLNLIDDVFEPKLILSLIKLNSNPLEIREVDKLIFKGKCFSVVSEASIKYPTAQTPTSIFTSLHRFHAYLSVEILHLLKENTTKLADSFINSLFSFNSEIAGGPFFGLMFTKENWGYYKMAFEGMKPFERKLQVKKLILNYIPNTYLKNISSGSGNNENIISGIASILSSLSGIQHLIDDKFLEEVISSGNKNLIKLVSYIAIDNIEILKKYTKYLLSTFSDSYLIKNEPISKQISRTLLLLCIVSHLDSLFLLELLKSKIFLDAISNRLSSFSNNVKSLGVVLADRVCELSGQEKIFNIEDLEGYDKLAEEIDLEKSIPEIEEAWALINSPEEIEEIEDQDMEVEIEGEVMEEILRNVTSLLHKNDSDDESDDEDPTISRRKRLVAPLYIKDILGYISVDTTKDEYACEKRRLALTTAPTLLRQKASFGNEVALYAEDLIANLLAMTNHFDEKDFDSLRLNAMIAVIVSYPTSVKYLIQLLGSGDYSLQQRMCCLSCISLSARNLKGFEDEVVVKSYNNSIPSFPSKILPGDLHNKYLALQHQAQRQITFGDEVVEKSLQDDLIENVSKDFKGFMSSGKILRKSKKLTTQNNTSVSKTKSKELSKIIGPNFFIHLFTYGMISMGLSILDIIQPF